jgi:hypothetical protein
VGGVEERKKTRVAVWHGKQKISYARARVSRTGERSGFVTVVFRTVGAVQSTLGVGVCVLVKCSLQFAKAVSATTQSQQENINLAGAQRGRVNVTSSTKWRVSPPGEVPSASSSCWP